MHKLNLLWAAKHETEKISRQLRTKKKTTEEILAIEDSKFIQHFRLNKETFLDLCSSLKNETNLKATTVIPLELKVLCALSFFATGSYQRIVGVSVNITQQTTSRYIRDVVDALNADEIVNKWICFPQTTIERNQIKEQFYRKFDLPGVVGAIDCTHLNIVRPWHDEHLYFNRKGYHSLNVQMICDTDLMIRNVNARFGGASHDSFIWATSEVAHYMQGLHQNGEMVWILGDSGYPLRPWLMTPILNAVPGSPEDIYTQRHIRARNTIERCFGLLKSRWRCLLKDRALHYHPQKAAKITVACCVLHNIAIKARLPPPVNSIAGEDGGNGVEDLQMNISNINSSDLIQGRRVLSSLISRLVS